MTTGIVEGLSVRITSYNVCYTKLLRTKLGIGIKTKLGIGIEIKLGIGMGSSHHLA